VADVTREPADGAPPAGGVPPAVRRIAVWVAVARYAIPLVAVPLIPVLIRDHLLLLVLLRPQKEFLLLGAGVARVQGEPSLWGLLAAYVPLMLFAVWAFFVVGRAYGVRLRQGTGPPWLQRVLRPTQVELAQRVLSRRGPAIAILGRLAAFPPTVLAAAAGVSDVPARRYLTADGIGALLAFAVTIGAGYLLGEAWQQGGVWLTALGLAVFVALVALLTMWVRREARRGELPDEADQRQPRPWDGPS
jgi:membrane protein DedA with SNARE-associated domain